jgi:hypothetical protein
VAGAPLKQRVLASLRTRAAALDVNATPLDYVCAFIANGGRVVDLAKQIGDDIGTSVSRSFISGVVHALADDASQRIDAARRQSADALVEEAAQIADDAEPLPASVAKASLQVKTRHWMAERFAPDQFGVKGSTINVINAGQLMLEALRQPIATLRPITAESDEPRDQ